MVLFLRATKPGEDPLAGVSTLCLVSFAVNVKGWDAPARQRGRPRAAPSAAISLALGGVT